MSEREAVVQEALSWLGTPYHHQAAIKGVGVDCAMLLVAVYGARRLIPPELDPRPYSPEWHLHRGEEIFLGWLQQCGERVDAPAAGDVAVWRFGRTFSHGAIVVDDDGAIVHAVMGARVVTLGHLHETELRDREVQYWRVRGIDVEMTCGEG